jgi:deazaflavin-dependent oxidoreductase (nitroreductase family)
MGPVIDRMWPLLRRLAGAHTAAYRLTKGRVGHRHRGLPPMLLLDHVGARSGIRRTSPLVYVRDGERYVLVASKGGFSQHPAWFHNLRAHPDTTVQVGARRLAVHARVATPEERARLWPEAVRTYRGYAGYQRRAGREIPLVVLEPRG